MGQRICRWKRDIGLQYFLEINVYVAEIEFNNLLILLLGIIDMIKAEW